MSYSGKFDAEVSSDVAGLHSGGHGHAETIHATHAPSDAIVVPDAHLLFLGDYKRSGVDLIISKDDRELVLHDYFKGEKRAALSSPDGAHLTGDLVNALSGHVQYAQADGSAGAGKVIGHVTNLVGTVTAMRNGVVITLNAGDNVEKGDVVQSGSNSKLIISFIDGTVFAMSADARMVLNEMIYDPNGSNNSSLLSLVAGTISFVAGETAKHGDMKVATPVATMGIRGTAILTHIDIHIPLPALDPGAPPLDLALLAPSGNFLVLVEPDGHRGSAWMYEPSTLTPLAELTDQQINISQGTVTYSSEPLPPDWQNQIDELFRSKYSANPKSLFTQNDTLIPQGPTPFHLASGSTATPLVLFTATPATNSSSSSATNGPSTFGIHIDQPPEAVASGSSITVHTGTALNSGFDTASGTIGFTDTNVGDRPTVNTTFNSLKLLNAQHNDITAMLTPQQIAAVEAQLVVTPSPGNNNNGSATWTYNVADSAFIFLTAGETLTLTYNAVVNNNYQPLDQVASVPFTITINGPSGEEWIHPTGGLWSVGSNWSSDNVPTATDDAIIPAQNIPGGTGLYDVAIETPAVARTLTLNANDTTGGQVTNDSTLTIGETLTIFNDGVLNNSGTVSVGTQMELLNQSSLQNSGHITLGQGGDFKDSSTVTNSGTIEIAGGTLNVEVDIANKGGTIQVDTATTEAILKLDGGAAITNGNLTIGALGVLDVEQGPATLGAGVPDATLDGVAIANGGNIEIGTAGTSDPTLLLDDGTVISNGNLTIGALGVLDVEQGPALLSEGTPDATLDGVAVANGGNIDISGALLLDQGTTITNGGTGAITVEITGTLTLDGATISDGATIDGGTVTNNGTLDLYGNAVLESGFLGNIGDIYVTGTGNALTGETVTANNLLEVKAGGALTIDPSTVTNNGGTIQVDAASGDTGAGQLTLNGTTVTGGKVTNQIGGEIDLTGNAVLQNGSLGNIGDIYVTGTGNALEGETVTANNLLEVKAGGALTIDPTTIANASGTITVDGTATLTLNGATLNGGTINDYSTVSGSIVAANIYVTGPSTISNALLNNGGVTVANGVTLTLNNDTVNGTTFDTGSGATIQIDDGTVLMLTGGATLFGGTINDGTASGTGDPVFGSIYVTGPSTITDALLNNGGVTVANGVTLTLDNDAVNGTTIALNSSSDTTQLEISGNVLLDGGGQVTLTDNTHNAIVSGGSAATLTNSDTITGAGTIGDTYLTLVNSGTIDATGTHPLTIDTGINTPTSAGPEGSHWSVGSLTVTNNPGAVLEASAGHTLQIDDNVLNDGLIEAGNTGGTSVAVVNVTGNITGTGSIELFNKAEFEIGGSVSSGQIVNFEVSNGAAELILDDPQRFQGLVKGLVEASSEAAENYIDLKGFSYTFETKVVSASFNSTTDITAVTITNGNSNGHSPNVTIDLSGDYQKGDIEFANDGAGGTLFSDPAANSGAVTIDSGTTLDIAAASTATVSFANGNGNTGELVLDDSKDFTGTIAGFTGDGTISNSDLIDLADVNIANVAVSKTGYTDNGNGTGTLTLYNANGQALDSINFDGNYQLANFTIENDGDGGTLIVDPPVHTNGQAPAQTVVASGPNQMLSGSAPADNFVFDFAGVGRSTIADFHPETDTLQFSSSIFANAQAALKAAHDDGHGNLVIAIDAHDSVTLTGVLKVQLHASDFHVV